MTPNEEQRNDQKGNKKAIRWFKRLGVAGFLFFLIKGLIWLALFYFGTDLLSDWFEK